MVNYFILMIIFLFVLPLNAQLMSGQLRGKQAIFELSHLQSDYNSSNSLSSLKESSGLFNVQAFEVKNVKYNFFGKFKNINLGSESLTVGQGATVIDSTLLSQYVGVGLTHKFKKSGDTLNITLSRGSSSDSSYGDAKENIMNINVIYSLEKQKDHQWIFLLNYSNNRGFLDNLPLPSLAYMYIPNKNFIAILGVPFISLTWINFPKYLHTFKMTPGGLNLDLSWFYKPFIRFYGQVDMSGKSFLHENRTNKDYRLYLVEKKITIGTRLSLSRELLVELSAGYSYDKSLFEGDGLSNRVGARQSLPDGSLFMAKVKYSY